MTTAIHPRAPSKTMNASLFKDLVGRIAAEESDSARTLHLTANENVLSKLAARFTSGPLYGRYHLGHANKREIARYGTSFLGLLLKSLPAVHELEQEALRASARIFGADYSDFRPLSGVHAIISTLAALTSVNDRIYCLHPGEGGHFATTEIIARLGRHCSYLPWDNAACNLDLTRLEDAFARHPPQCIYLDHSSAFFPLYLRELRALAGSRVTIVYDASHPLGLIAGKAFENPLEMGADVLQGNTHKSFPGPQKAMVMTKSPAIWRRIDETMNVFVSSQHSGDTLALYITTLEMEAFGQQYAGQIVKNSIALSAALAHRGFSIFRHGANVPASHQILLLGFEAGENLRAAQILLGCGISVNSKTALGRSAIRLGIQEVTRLGMRETEMDIVADFLSRALIQEQSADLVRRDVRDFVADYTSPGFSFDSVVGL
jgi:glycine/serine hydroxymethyltransferase